MDFDKLYADGYQLTFENNRETLWIEPDRVDMAKVEELLKQTKFRVMERRLHDGKIYEFSTPLYLVVRQGHVEFVPLYRDKPQGSKAQLLFPYASWYKALLETIQKVAFSGIPELKSLEIREFPSLNMNRPTCHHELCVEAFNAAIRNKDILLNAVPVDQNYFKYPLCSENIKSSVGEKYPFYVMHDLKERLDIELCVLKIDSVFYIPKKSVYFNLKGSIKALTYTTGKEENDVAKFIRLDQERIKDRCEEYNQMDVKDS